MTTSRMAALALGLPASAPAAALPHATPAERMAMQRALTLANTTCTTCDPVAGAWIAGGLEGRAGLSPADLDTLG